LGTYTNARCRRRYQANQKLSNEQRTIEQLVTRACKGAEQVRWAIDLTSPMALMLITVLLCTLARHAVGSRTPLPNASTAIRLPGALSS
jgi:hypothetical protein